MVTGTTAGYGFSDTIRSGLAYTFQSLVLTVGLIETMKETPEPY